MGMVYFFKDSNRKTQKKIYRHIPLKGTIQSIYLLYYSFFTNNSVNLQQVE